MANKKEKKESLIGKQVTYNPNNKDFGTRPKATPVPAIVVNEYDLPAKVKGKDGNKKEITRKVVNLIVFHDGEVSVAKRVRIPHKDDALEGESYYE